MASPSATARAGFPYEASVNPYTKPYLTYAEQLELLQRRGLVIADRRRAQHILSTVGYYRLSGYWYPYRTLDGTGRSDHFDTGTTFDQVLALYDMDRRLKLHVLGGIERIEIAMRVRVGHALGRRHAFAHLDPAYLDGRFTECRAGRCAFDGWRKRLTEAQERSTEEFVKHFKENYGGQLPVWVATEIMDFGTLSHLYSGAKRNDRDAIATSLGVADMRGKGNGAAVANWMRVLNYLRNVCAHHSRLWNRNMTVQVAPRWLGDFDMLAHIMRADSAAHDRV